MESGDSDTGRQEVGLALPWPPSVNRYWRYGRGRFYIEQAGQDYRNAVARSIRRHGADRFADTDRLAVEVAAMPPDKRKRDLDNVLKALLDSMQDQYEQGMWVHRGLYKDDSQIDDLRIVRREVVKGGKVEVRLWKI